MADENRDMPETVANEIARIRKHFEEFGEHRLSDAHLTIRWLADRLEQAERDSKRLDWLSQNEYGLRAIDGNSYHAAPLDVRDLIDAAIAASLPTPKQGGAT